MKTERALIAVNFMGHPIILTTDGATIAWDMENIPTTDAEELGLFGHRKACLTPGLYVWEGRVRHQAIGPEYLETETIYDGTIRYVSAQEQVDLFKMAPPDEFDDDRETVEEGDKYLYHPPTEKELE